MSTREWQAEQVEKSQEVVRLTNDLRKELAPAEDPRWDRVDDLLAELGYWSGR